MQAETIEVNYPVDAGQVQIAWPGSIGEDEITEVENWLHMMVNRMSEWPNFGKERSDGLILRTKRRRPQIKNSQTVLLVLHHGQQRKARTLPDC